MAQGNTSFVGRAAELNQLCGLLEARSLVTVVGEGGVGKTRLTREVADALSAAAWPVFWVGLGAATGPAGVRASFEDALRSTGRDTTFERLIEERVPVGRSLVVIDNCEHVLDDVATRVEALGALRPDARVLATSRARLGVNGEVVYRLTPLEIPSPDAALAAVGEVASVALLIDRLRDVVADFDLDLDNVGDIVTIARRTEGVPLAIEIVAAAAGVLPLPEIVRGVPDSLGVGAADARREPRRHRSLDASVRWSVDRLGAPAGVAFRRLGAFADSFRFATAVRVISEAGDRDDRQATRSFVELVEASLVRRLDDDRFSLPMAVRTLAREELGSDARAAAIRDRHAEVVYDLAAEAAAGLRERGEAHEPWLRVIDDELPEIRAAIDWQLRRRQPGRAAEMLLNTYDHAHVRGRYGEVLAQCRTVLEDPDLNRTDGARLSSAAAMLAVMAGRLVDSYDFAERALADSDDPVVRGNAHLQRAWTGFFSGRIENATLWADLDEGLRLAREQGDDELEATALVRRGSLTVYARSIPDGREILAGARSSDLALSHQVLAPRVFAVYGIAVFGLELDQLFPNVVELIDDCRAAGHVAYESMALATAGTITALWGDADHAGQFLDEAARLTHEHELATFQNIAQRWRAFAHYRFDLSDTIEQAERAIEFAESTDNAWDAAAAHWLLGLALLRRDDGERAIVHLRIAADGSIDPDYPFSRIRAELALALVDLGNDAFPAGLGRAHDALRRANEHGDILGLAAALDHLARFECERSAFDRAGRFAGAADAIHHRAGVERLPCERDLRAFVERRVVDHSGTQAAQRSFEEGRSLDPAAAVRLARRSRGRRARPVSGWSSLTPTELEVADLAADGLTNQAIAERLVMSANTVKTHLSHIYTKIAVSGRSGLAAERARRSKDS